MVGVRWLRIIVTLMVASGLTTMTQAEYIDRFDELEAQRWQVVLDGVMGGRSRAEVSSHDHYMLFSGYLSLENNGGFATVRRNVTKRSLGAERIRIEVMGDGREYQLRLRPHRGWDGVAYTASFKTSAGQTQTFEFKADDFTAVFRGRTVRNAPDITTIEIYQLGVMVADKSQGDFGLKIYSIAFPVNTTALDQAR